MTRIFVRACEIALTATFLGVTAGLVVAVILVALT